MFVLRCPIEVLGCFILRIDEYGDVYDTLEFDALESFGLGRDPFLDIADVGLLFSGFFEKSKSASCINVHSIGISTDFGEKSRRAMILSIEKRQLSATVDFSGFGSCERRKKGSNL